MFSQASSHRWAIAQALFVTLLWSSSWVLIKIGLDEIPALTFAGLRYCLAALCLLPFVVLRSERRAKLRALSSQDWGWLALLGLVFYALTQGAQFVGLAYLPAVTVSLMLNFTPVVVALMGIPLLGEYPRRWQWIGVALFIIGAVVYFYPPVFPAQQVIGLLVVAVGVLSNAGSSVLGRFVNRRETIDTLTITGVSMAIGAALLLTAGVTTQGLPTFSWTGWGIVLWLAVVNTAFAFTLWNHTLRTLPAMQSSVINSTMLIQIAILAWVFLGERINWIEGIGLVCAAAGVLIVQLTPVQRSLRRARSSSSASESTPESASTGYAGD